MFVKLYSRITESSLMEQPIEVRYTFLMLLAIADPSGRVVGTDIAIARRINLPLDNFVKSVKALQDPDPDSNSKEEEGRRVVHSDGERGYQLVNFAKYRNLKDEDEKREYMRTYMRQRRESVKNSNSGKEMLNVLTKVTQAEEEEEEEEEAKAEEEPKAEENKSCSEPPAASEPAVMIFPCVGTGKKEWPLIAAKVSELKESFPGIDVIAECRKARQWCIDNPAKRKTFNGMARFLSGWLGRAQDAPKIGVNGRPPEKTNTEKMREAIDGFLANHREDSK